MRSATAAGDEDPEAPVYAAMDLLGQRWVLRVIWELEPGALGFLELRRRMGNCSSSMLADRLATLTAANIVTKLPDKCYEITPAGWSLGRALEGVWQWAEAHAGEISLAARAPAGEGARRR